MQPKYLGGIIGFLLLLASLGLHAASAQDSASSSGGFGSSSAGSPLSSYFANDPALSSGSSATGSTLSLDNTVLSTEGVYLKLDGVEGDAQDPMHRGEMEVRSFDWSLSRLSTPRGAGAFHIVLRASKASPALFQAAGSGERFSQAVLSIRKSGRGMQDIEHWILSDVTVSSYKTNGKNEQDILPTDEIELSFGKIELEYAQPVADGTLGSPLRMGWDVRANRPL